MLRKSIIFHNTSKKFNRVTHSSKFFHMSSSQVTTSMGVNIPLTSNNSIIKDKDIENVKNFLPFKQWFDKISEWKHCNIKTIEIQNVDYFGSRVGFVKIKANIEKEGKQIPGIVFARGGSVGILVVLECDGKEYTLLTEQPRVPAGKENLLEIPAGMVDGSGHFVGKAAEEMKEETGLDLKENELIDMTSIIYGSKFNGMLPSPGGSDEFLRLFVYRAKVSSKFLNHLEGKCTGLRDEGEFISLRIMPLEDAIMNTPDAKLLSSYTLFQRLKAENHLSEPLDRTDLQVPPSST